MSEGDYDDFEERDGITCPRCQGDGTVDCHCGGDLCVCLNYGQRDCPTCYGEGEVSEGREAQYNEARRQAFEVMTRDLPAAHLDMETLEPLKSPSGHDAYCHVCWEPTFRFWRDKQAPDYSRCGVGEYTAQTCPNATSAARQKAAVARLKEAGLWVGSLGASLAAEARTAGEIRAVGTKAEGRSAPNNHPGTTETDHEDA